MIINWKNEQNIGVGLKFLNLLLFTIMSLLIMKFAANINIWQVLLIINLVGIVTLLILKLLRPKLDIDSPRKHLYIYRGLCNIAGMYLWLKALSLMPMNDATAIAYMTPIFASFIAVWLLKEKFEYYHLFAMMISFGGMMIILQPKADMFNNSGILYALASALVWAVNDIICKIQTAHDKVFTQLFMLFLFSTIITTPFAIYNWQEISSREFFALMECGFIALLNISILFLAFSKAPVTLLMPLNFARLIFMAVGSYLLFNETLKLTTIIGAILIISSSLYLIHANDKKMSALESKVELL